jgi:carbamoyl-phosphate synthase large subunit
MRSTGEVLGMADSFGLAFAKAEEAAGMKLPSAGTVLITVNKNDRPQALEAAREFHKLGFRVLTTEGCGRYFAEQGLNVETVFKVYQGRPNIIDRIKNNEINLIINTPAGRQSEHDDSYIRKAAVHYKLPYITTMAAAVATAKGIQAERQGKNEVKSLQEYHRGL